MGYEDELNALLNSFSISDSETLPTKVHRFMTRLFEGRGGNVPSLSWFKRSIPLSDPHGTIYDALVRLEEHALSHSPNSPDDVWDTVPLKVLIRWYLIVGCEAYKETAVHQESCTWDECEVCAREEELIGEAFQCWEYREWSEQHREELKSMPTHEGAIPCIPSHIITEFKQRL